MLDREMVVDVLLFFREQFYRRAVPVEKQRDINRTFRRHLDRLAECSPEPGDGLFTGPTGNESVDRYDRVTLNRRISLPRLSATDVAIFDRSTAYWLRTTS